ncbi:MAG: calcium/sodium antiporter [Candidatus Doudnabacteria bacterium]|nr:calcium/sodium antiporter [Candidatus Doudnabacteria bacterium]
MILLYLLGLLACFYLLAKICDQYFVQSLDIIAKKLRLSEDVAGATFMAIGTSAPEFFTAVLALFKIGAEDIGAGTIVGSALFNILVIIGGSALIAKAYVRWQPVVRDIGFYLVSILVMLFTFRDGHITAGETVIYLVTYAAYLLVLSQWSRWHTAPVTSQLEAIEENQKAEEGAAEHTAFGKLLRPVHRLLAAVFPNLDRKPHLYPVTFALSVVGIIALSWGLVEFGVLLAHDLGIPEAIVALTILAAGTSVPDLIASLVVAKQGRGDMAVSNAVGSNIFDVLIGLGLPWFVYILVTGRTVPIATESLFSSVLLLFATVIAVLFIFLIKRFHISRSSGLFLIGLYLLYLGYTIYGALNPNALNIHW